MTLLGGIEAGGTKVICAVASDLPRIDTQTAIPTTTPAETLRQAIEFFRRQTRTPAAVGVASFGPVDIDPSSAGYGRIGRTPKPGWTGTDVLGPLRAALGVPVRLDTDVNGAALAEARWGAGRGCRTLVYLTVGTGIGGGALVEGRLLHGLRHPEMGHIRIPHDPALDAFAGACPFHGDCLEGLASGEAIRQRWGQSTETLPPQHPAWELEAGYLAAGLTSIALTLSPERIVLGGGVMQQPQLLPLIRRRFHDLLAGYSVGDMTAAELDRYIVPSTLGGRAGVLGALALARDALTDAPSPS
jgi:fructokinase